MNIHIPLNRLLLVGPCFRIWTPVYANSPPPVKTPVNTTGFGLRRTSVYILPTNDIPDSCDEYSTASKPAALTTPSGRAD